MALNKQVWLQTIQENFFPDDSFAVKSIDDSAFISNKTVHVPNAGSPSRVVINRSQKPASVTSRNDNDLSYDIDELTTDPIYIPDIDKVELSYDKRQSVIANDRAQLQTTSAQNLLYRWGNVPTVFMTTGDSVPAYTSSTATGYRKAITKADVLKVSTKFNTDNVPQSGRYLLLDATMYNQLLADLTEKELSAFLAPADAQRGVLGRLYGFDVMLRSAVLRVKASDNTIIRWEADGMAAEKPAGLAWQETCVSRAMGEVKMFDNTDDPTYYGDIYSFLMRVGGSPRRYDKKGIALIVGDTGTAPQ